MATTPTTFVADTETHRFIAERARKGSRKLVFSAYRHAVREGDTIVPIRQVPLAIRRDARRHFGIIAA